MANGTFLLVLQTEEGWGRVVGTADESSDFCIERYKPMEAIKTIFLLSRIMPKSLVICDGYYLP